MQVQNISFGARYLKSATIQKKTPLGPEDYRVAMVELNPYDVNDFAAVDSIPFKWGSYSDIPKAYANNIKNIFLELSEQGSLRFYALTQQKENFENLESDLILSIAETSNFDDKTLCLELLETYFAESYTSKIAKFKHIGHAMLDNIKILSRGKDIVAEVAENAEKFYEKEGFERIAGGINRYIFRSIKF